MRPHIVLSSAITALLASTTHAYAASKPNVVIVLADDLGYAEVGFNGSRDVPTPHLDALAAAGVKCSNGYVSHPFCSPTRAGLMTGRYQQRFGHENNPSFDPNDDKLGLPLTEKMFPELMKLGGYATGCIGKWHLGAAEHFLPHRRGFDEWYGFPGGGHQYTPGKQGGKEYAASIVRNGEPQPFTGYLTDMLSDAAVDFVHRHSAEPFFLYVAYNAPHTPLDAPAERLSRFAHVADEKHRTYCAMVSIQDDGVGRIVDALKKHGLEENTLVVFFSDNGGPSSVTNCSNAPLRGQKGDVYEGGMRVPLVVKWPAKLKPGVYDRPVMQIDLLPTALAAAGIAPPADLRFDGVDLTPYLSGLNPGSPHDVLHWRTGGGKTWAVRRGDIKLLLEDDEAQLFDLSRDVGELVDLAAKQPEVVAELMKLHDAWNAELIAPLWQNPGGGRKKAAK